MHTALEYWNEAVISLSLRVRGDRGDCHGNRARQGSYKPADIGFNLHNPLDPLEPSPTTLDKQVPRPTTPRSTTPSTHNNIFFIPLDGNQIAGKVASHSPKMETKCQTG